MLYKRSRLKFIIINVEKKFQKNFNSLFNYSYSYRKIITNNIPTV